MAGTGADKCSYKEEKTLAKARESGIQVVMGSRCQNGRVVPLEKYAYLKALTSDNLSPQKARILLMVELLKYKDYPDLEKIFATY